MNVSIKNGKARQCIRLIRQLIAAETQDEILKKTILNWFYEKRHLLKENDSLKYHLAEKELITKHERQDIISKHVPDELLSHIPFQ